MVTPPVPVAGTYYIQVSSHYNSITPGRNSNYKNSHRDPGGGEYLIQASVSNSSTAVETKPGNQPLTFALMQNFPNPFNPSTTIKFTLAGNAMVSLKVYDVNGRDVSTLVNGHMTAGEHSVVWTPSNLSSGVYFYRITAHIFSTEAGTVYDHSRKMVYVR